MEEFKILKECFLGKGAFSSVYKGIDKDNRYVAIKIIDTDKLSMKSLEIVDDEIKILNMIKENPHPNIVECRGIIIKKEIVYIVMEYCDSGDLKDILKKPMKETYAQFYFNQLANGLRYLREQNIIHRDIKPRNILLTNKRRVLKIADFGFAKTVGVQSLHETVCGSPLYMAPEIMACTMGSPYNNQTDLWSIGILLFEMLYGYHPYDNCKDITELKKRMADTSINIPPVNNTNKGVSNECIKLLKNLLQKNVDNRLSWDDFFNDGWINRSIKNGLNLENITNVPKALSDSKINIVVDYYDKPESLISDDYMFDIEID